MGISKSRLSERADSRIVRFLPITAGTCLLVSINPCFANGDHHGPQSGGINSNVIHHQHNAVPQNQSLIVPHFAASGLVSRAYDLDLSSIANSVVLGSKLFNGADGVTIDVGGTKQTFHAGQQVTPGEFLAIQQVLAINPQTLSLNSQGAASGGSFSLNQAAAGAVGNLVVPTGVTAVDNFNTSRVIGLTGDLTNYGSIYGLSTSNHFRSGVISAEDISNSGLISTDLTGSSLSSSNTVRHVDLTLNANNSFSNSGTVSSTGALTIATNNSGVSNSGTLSAQNDLGIFSGNGSVTSSGAIVSAAGNLNFGSSVLPTDLNIAGAGGTFSALQGDINIREALYAGSNNINLDGGDYQSKNLNLNGGLGSITGSVGQVSGNVNSVGDDAHFYAATNTLSIGNSNINGDPTWANTAGSIVINGPVVAAESIAILASGDITASGNAYISTANATGTAAVPTTAVTLVAGYKVTTTGASTTGIPSPGSAIGAGKTATVDFTTGTGGNIDLSGSKYLGPIINTSSTLDSKGFSQIDGGSVILSAASTSTTNGRILFPTGRPSIDTSSLYDNGGAVTIFAGNSLTSSKAPAIRIGSINTSGAPGKNGGTVLIAAASTAGSTGAVTFDNLGNRTSASQIVQGGSNLGGIIQLAGTINAGNSNVTITSNPFGSGGFVQTGSGRIEGTNIALNAGAWGIGVAKDRVLTAAGNQLTLVTSSPDMFVNQLGSVNLQGSQAGDNGTFDLTTTPDSAGNGRINVAGVISSFTGTSPLANINLQSSDTVGGNGGIRNTAAGLLTALNIKLLDNPDGLGSGPIGTGAGAAQRINIGALSLGAQTRLSANTQGNVFLFAVGPVNLLASSAGNGQTFALTTGTNAASTSGTITLTGGIKTATGTIGQINLTSSEFGGTGGIIGGSKSVVTADRVNLTNLLGTSATLGVADLGNVTTPLTLKTSTVSLQTNGNVNVIDTITTGVNIVNSLAGNGAQTFTLVSSSGIQETGIASGAGITLTAGGSNGYVILDGNLTVGSASGTLTVTAAGTGNITTGAGVGMAVAQNVILNTKTGGAGSDQTALLINATNLTANTVGFTNIYDQDTSGGATTKPLTLVSFTTKNQFNLASDNAIDVVGGNTTATGIKISVSNVFATSDIVYQNNLGSSKKTNYIQLDTDSAAAAAISTNSQTAVLASKNVVTLSAAGGAIGAGIALKVLTPNLAANTTGGVGRVTIQANATKGGTTLLDSGSNGNFSLNALGSLNLTHLVTTNGSISVVSAGTLLQALPSAIIQVGDPAHKGASANSILIQDTNSKGNIVIGHDSVIGTFVMAPGTGIAGSGSIRILTTSTPTQTNMTLPTNVVQGTNMGGHTFFGVNGITALAPNNTMNNVGADITFDTGTRPATAISLGGNVAITADPPVIAGTGAVQQSMDVTNVVTNAVAASNVQVQSIPHIGDNHFAQSTILPISQFGTNEVPATLSNSYVPVGSNPLYTLANLSTVNATSQDALSSAFRSVGQVAWGSESELIDGEIPATILSDNDLGIAPEVSVIVEIEAVKNELRKNALTNIASGAIAGGVSKDIETVKTFNLKRGTAVFAPAVDTYVNTPVGKIKIGAGALALVMSFGGNVAIYDLDDSHRGSVAITAAGKTISLYPGMHVSIAADGVSQFADVNPAQMIGYRNIAGHVLGSGLKAFCSEFSVPHAIAAVQPLKHLLESKNRHSKKIANHLIKTIAVAMQINGAKEDYQQVFRAQKTAYNQ